MGLFIRKYKDGRIVVGSRETVAGGIEGGPPEHFNFDEKWVTREIGAGTVSLGRGTLTIHATDGDISYLIKRVPGAYCLYCKDRIGDGPARTPEAAALRREYVRACQKSPNDMDEHEAGYEVIHYYEGALFPDLDKVGKPAKKKGR
jgi:hypothetical protein